VSNASGCGRWRVIRASEIGEYAYCAHAWWLGNVEGLASGHQREMAAGEAIHLRHGQGVRASLGLARLAYAVLLLALVIGVVWLVSWLIS
jgi:CRISPR/Cas system-associated exonuclease Cas4 (RecB family)